MDISIPIAILIACGFVIFLALAWFFGTVFFAARAAWEYFDRENQLAKQRLLDDDEAFDNEL